MNIKLAIGTGVVAFVITGGYWYWSVIGTSQEPQVSVEVQDVDTMHVQESSSSTPAAIRNNGGKQGGAEGVGMTANKVQDSSNVFYEVTEGWGPCLPGATCYSKTDVYTSGRVVSSDGSTTSETSISATSVTQMENLLRDTNLTDSDLQCGANSADYTVTRTITLDGTSRVAHCTEGFEQIDALIRVQGH